MFEPLQKTSNTATNTKNTQHKPKVADIMSTKTKSYPHRCVEATLKQLATERKNLNGWEFYDVYQLNLVVARHGGWVGHANVEQCAKLLARTLQKAQRYRKTPSKPLSISLVLDILNENHDMLYYREEKKTQQI